MNKHEREFLTRVINSLKFNDMITSIMEDIEIDLRKDKKKKLCKRNKPNMALKNWKEKPKSGKCHGKNCAGFISM